MTSPLVPDAIPASDYQLALHPSDPTALIVVDASGVPVQGLRIIVGDAEAKGDVSHDASKGPIVKSPNGTKYRLGVNDDGTPANEVV